MIFQSISKIFNVGGKRLLGIPTILDKTVQHFFELVIELVTEAFADKNSFGFPKQTMLSCYVDKIYKVYISKTNIKIGINSMNLIHTLEASNV